MPGHETVNAKCWFGLTSIAEILRVGAFRLLVAVPAPLAWLWVVTSRWKGHGEVQFNSNILRGHRFREAAVSLSGHGDAG